MADDDDWMNADVAIQVPKDPEIPLPPALSVPTFVPGPSAASSGAAGGGSAAPKYRTIAVEFDDQHNQERSDLVVMMDAVSTSAKCPTPHPLCAVIPVCDPVFRRTEPLRFATRPELREYPEFGEMVGSRIAALREAFGKEYVNVLVGILSEEQAGKGLNLKDLEKLSKMVGKVCFSVKKAAGRKATQGQTKGGKGKLQEGNELDYDDYDAGGGENEEY